MAKINPSLESLIVPIASLELDPNNVRKHNEKNMDSIRASLKQFGQQKPIVVTEQGIILAGNGTYSAALDLGWTKIAVSVSDLPTEEAEKAYAIADNRTNDLSFFDDGLLKESLQELKDKGFDVEHTGFNDYDLESVAWDSDIEAMDKVEENDDGVPAKIVIECDQEDEELVKTAIQQALVETQVSWTFK